MKNQIYNYFLTSVLHPFKHIRILNSNCSSRYPWDCFIVFHISSVDWSNWTWGDRTNKNSNSSILGSPTRSIHSIVNIYWIINPRVIEKDYLSIDLSLEYLQLIPIFDDNYFPSYITECYKMYPATEYPNPITYNFEAIGLGEIIVSDSYPRTHFVKFLTGSSLTLSKLLLMANLCIQSIARSRLEDPHRRGPNVSTRYASWS